MGGIVRQNENEDELTSHDALQMFPRFNRIRENSGGVTKEMLEETWPHFFGSKRSIDDDNWFDKGFDELEYKNIEYTDRCLTAEIKMGSVRFDEISSFGLKEYRQIKKGFFLSWRSCSFSDKMIKQELDVNIGKTGYHEWIGEPKQFSLNGSVYCRVRLICRTVP